MTDMIESLTKAVFMSFLKKNKIQSTYKFRTNYGKKKKNLNFH